MKNGLYKKCDLCLKEHYIKPCRINKYKNTFCSRKCSIVFKKNNAFKFPCKICGIDIYTQKTQLKYRARSTCSPQCRKILRDNNVNEKRKKYGMTKHQIDRAERYSKNAIDWRKSVFERDDYTCQFCGLRGTYLEADHIKPWAYFPDLRYELSNGRTLCKPCHNTTKIGYKKLKDLYGIKD